jgi:hypothetical protein
MLSSFFNFTNYMKTTTHVYLPSVEKNNMKQKKGQEKQNHMLFNLFQKHAFAEYISEDL